METDTTTALLRSMATERDPKRLGVINRLLAWVRKQLGRLRDFFFGSRKPISKTCHDEDHSDNDTVAASVCELPEQTLSRPLVAAKAPELTPEPQSPKKEILSVAEPLDKTLVGPPRTMEEALEVINKKSKSRRASLPASFATAASTPKQQTQLGKAIKPSKRRASYAVGSGPLPPLPPKAVPPPSKAIEWVSQGPAMLKKTPSSRAMLDGSLERSISSIARINEEEEEEEEEDPKIAWEKPEWAKQGSGRDSLRKSFSHNLW